jgi:hypothetical protein
MISDLQCDQLTDKTSPRHNALINLGLDLRQLVGEILGQTDAVADPLIIRREHMENSGKILLTEILNMACFILLAND